MKPIVNNGPYGIYAIAEVPVEFFDIDTMRVVWHGNYFKYFESARRALLDKLDYDYGQMEESGYAFPIVETSAKYIASLKSNDTAVVKAVLIEYENRLKMQFEIKSLKTGQITTKGSSTQMAFDLNKMESCFLCPKILFDKVEALLGANIDK